MSVSKQQLLVFKQHFSYFHTLFHPHVFLQKFLNNNFQFLNASTKRALNVFFPFVDALGQRWWQPWVVASATIFGWRERERERERVNAKLALGFM